VDKKSSKIMEFDQYHLHEIFVKMAMVGANGKLLTLLHNFTVLGQNPQYSR
jgi:hypothetical protein